MPNENEAGILTKDYKNGSAIKKVELSNGRTAIVRKLRGRDFVETKKRVQDDNSIDFETANMSVAVTFDDKKEPPEYFLDDLFQEDYAKLTIASGTLNLT